VIDEAQRVPDLLLAIKQRVDREQRAGEFLLTGSANVLTSRTVADALTGRAEYYRLWPLTQGEIGGVPESFISAMFARQVPQLADAPVGRGPHAPILTAGGYPEARLRSPRRRARFFESYIDTVLERDLGSIGRVEDSGNVRRLLDAVAATSASLVNYDGLSRDLDVSANTLRSYIGLLETLFLVRRLPAWHTNLLSRIVKAPKAYVTDSGLLAHLLGADDRRIEDDGQVAGRMFETFVTMELLRQAEWQDNPPRLYHYRDRDGREVDVILERRDGSMIGVEVKAGASVQRSDFRGLRHLREKLGSRFKSGVVLYTGAQTIPFGDRLAAVPLQALWTT
jgi:predicted AAA+ superfamily ATPase